MSPTDVEVLHWLTTTVEERSSKRQRLAN